MTLIKPSLIKIYWIFINIILILFFLFDFNKLGVTTTQITAQQPQLQSQNHQIPTTTTSIMKDQPQQPMVSLLLQILIEFTYKSKKDYCWIALSIRKSNHSSLNNKYPLIKNQKSFPYPHRKKLNLCRNKIPKLELNFQSTSMKTNKN